MASPTPHTVPAIPPELLADVAERADADADRVVLFLQALGLAPAPGQTRALPAAFLLDLGAALRLLAWEAAGLDVHRQAGLPAALDAIRRAFAEAPGYLLRDPTAPAPYPPLFRAVLRLTADRLAWAGRRDLGADVVLGDPDEDALIEALAAFLWAHRRPTPATPDPRALP